MYEYQQGTYLTTKTTDMLYASLGTVYQIS
jgi:hypothetical protein